MSYCRWGPESDVYIYATVDNGPIVCCGCRFQPVNEHDNYPWNDNYETTDPFEMIGHAIDHEFSGDKVPAKVFHRLWREFVDGVGV